MDFFHVYLLVVWKIPLQRRYHNSVNRTAVATLLGNTIAALPANVCSEYSAHRITRLCTIDRKQRRDRVLPPLDGHTYNWLFFLWITHMCIVHTQVPQSSQCDAQAPYHKLSLRFIYLTAGIIVGDLL